jgi:predicted metalloprotease with PDZ domain
MRTMFALQAMERANITRQQQYLQQQMAAQRARADQARLRGIMSRAPVGESSFSAAPVVETPEERQQVSDLLLVWEVLGCTFDALITDAVRAVDSRFDAGLRVAAIKVGGAADRAGWEAGDILVGLYRYRIRSYDNVAFVADLPDLMSLSPMRALLIRSGKVIELPLDFHGAWGEEEPAAESGEAPATHPAPEESPPADPGAEASAIGTEADVGGVVRVGGGAVLRSAPAEIAAASQV